MKKPRPFSLPPIYIDARQERLDAVARRAGGASAPVLSLQRPRQGRAGLLLGVPMLLSVVLILLAVVLLIIFS